MTNEVNCAMLAAFILSMPERPDVQRLTDYYARAMMTGLVRRVFRASGKSQFTEKDIEGMRRTAALRAGDRNPYSWNMDFYEYPDGSGYEARFSRCGICTLMQELGLQDLTPALCHLDYTMAEARGSATFVREYTLASGGPYCDCGYKNGRSEKSALPQVRGRAPAFFFRVVKCAAYGRTKRKPLHPLGHRGYIVWCAVQDSNL